METNNAKIIVCCHKPDKWKSDEVYMPVQGGKAISDIDLGIQGDDTGDNISAKNKTYCELTSIYWAWKNLKNIDYVGLCHYRRYFNFNNRGSAFFDLISVKPEDFEELNLTPPDFDKVFRKYDIILAKPRVYPVSIYTDYCLMHYSDDIRQLERVIIQSFPEFKDSVVNFFHKTNKVSHYNMFVMKWEIFEKYCEWLFFILNETEKVIDISNYSDEQKRIWGFMSERLLLGLYVYHNKFKVKYYNVYFINDYIRLKSTLHRFQRYFRKNLAFKIGKSVSQ